MEDFQFGTEPDREVKGRAKMRILLFVLVAVVPCSSQSTWSGLRFGMTPEQARQTLKDRPNKDRTAPANAEQHTPETFFIDVQDVTVAQYTGSAHLRFGKTQKLDQVKLDFNRYNETRGCFKGISDEEVGIRSRTLIDITEKMIERFGKPVSETGSFPTSRELGSYYAGGVVTGFALALDGTRIWRAEGQVIEEYFSLPCGNLFLIINYKAQTKDEL